MYTHQSIQEIQHLYHPEHSLIFVGPEHQSSKIYHAFSNYIKTTLNNGLSLSEVDLSHLKRETTNDVSNLMEVDWGGNIDSNYTSTTRHGPSFMEVDWGGNVDPNYASSGWMLMQVDWGGKLTVNHIYEYMLSEVDWGAHETQNMDTASLKLIGEIMIQPFTLWMDAYSLKLIGAMSQVYSCTLCTLIMLQSQWISSPKDCGEDYNKNIFHPSHGVPE